VHARGIRGLTSMCVLVLDGPAMVIFELELEVDMVEMIIAVLCTSV
jgi:hypothetical protein